MEELKTQIDHLDEDDERFIAPINQLPEEILERIFSFTSQYNDYINIGLVCKKWHRIIVGLIELNKSSFASCFQTGEIEWQCLSAPETTESNNHQRANNQRASTNHQEPVNVFQMYPQHRHSHSCAILGGHTLYIFGGLSATSTAYNDLWSLDLNTKRWTRPATSGSYPSPKAAATLLARDSTRELVLFGGYSHPYTYSFSQHVNFFDEFHVYSVRSASWQAHVFTQEAPKLAGHSASFIRNYMILFGGCNTTLGNKSNSVYCLDLDTYTWLSVNSNSNTNTSNPNNMPQPQQPHQASSSSYWRTIDGLRPEARYGHSQITLDEERILIVGGVGGPNKQFDDAWILHWPSDAAVNARWERVLVRNVINAPSQPYCIPFVQCCGDKLVTFGKARSFSFSSNTSNGSLVGPTIENHVQSNGELSSTANNNSNNSTPMTIHGSVKQIRPRVCSCSNSNNSAPVHHHPSTANSSIEEIKERTQVPKASNDLSSVKIVQMNGNNGVSNGVNQSGQLTRGVILNKSQLNTLKRHEVLKKLADKYNPAVSRDRTDTEYRSTLERQLSSRCCVVHSRLMQVFVLDISKCLIEPHQNHQQQQLSVSWQTPIAHFTNAPCETTLYSLALGIDEIILFGGMEIDSAMPYNMRPSSSYEHVKHRVSNKVFVMKPRQLFNNSNTRTYSTFTAPCAV